MLKTVRASAQYFERIIEDYSKHKKLNPSVDTALTLFLDLELLLEYQSSYVSLYFVSWTVCQKLL